MAFVLTTDTIPGTAQWVAVTPYTGLMFVDNQYAGGSSDGSIVAPFTTIQAALDAIGTPVDATDAAISWTVLITTGFYDENLVLPARRALSLEGIAPSYPISFSPGISSGQVHLHDGIPTNTRTITLDVTTPNPLGLGSGDIPVQIKNFELIDGMSFSQDAALAGPNDTNVKLSLENVSFRNVIDPVQIPDCIRATGWDAGNLYLDFKNCNLAPLDGVGTGLSISAAAKIVIVVRAESSSFATAIEVDRYVSFSDCEFEGDITLTAGVSPGQRVGGTGGFINCGFRGVKVLTSGVAGSGLVDATSFESFVASGWTLAGAATIVGSADQWIEGNTPAGGAPWGPGGDNTLSNAISRMAELLFFLNGNVNIP